MIQINEKETQKPKQTIHIRIHRLGSPLPASISEEKVKSHPTLPLEIRPLLKPDPRGFLFQTLMAWIGVAAAIGIAEWMGAGWVKIVAVFFMATRQNLLALLTHEQAHRLGFRSMLGDLISNLFCSYPLFITTEGYANVHLAHHRHFFTDQDPDYLRKQGKEWTFPQRVRYFVSCLLKDVLGINIVKTLQGKHTQAGGQLYRHQTIVHRLARIAYYLGVMGLLTYFQVWPEFFLYWVLPLSTLFQLIVKWGALTEHKYNLTNPSITEATPIIELKGWEKFFLPNLNFTLHAYHHYWPGIPQSKLPKVHEIFKREKLIDESRIFHGYFSYLKYLFTPEKQKTQTRECFAFPKETDIPNMNDTLKHLTRLVPHRWMLAAAFDWSFIFLASWVAVWAQNPFVYALAILVIGSRQHALGILAHEGTHHAALPKPQMNDLLTGVLCFWPILLSVKGWRRFHFAHHKFVGSKDDPELAGKGADSPLWDLPKTWPALIRNFLIDLMGLGIRDVLKMRKASQDRDPWGSYDNIGKLIWHVVFLAGCLVFGFHSVFILWYGALITSSWAFSRLRMWTEHIGTAFAHRISIRFWQRIFLPHNTWYHYEHHKYPAVPFYNLPKIRELDTTDPVLDLYVVFKAYQNSPRIPSGAALVENLKPRVVSQRRRQYATNHS